MRQFLCLFGFILSLEIALVVNGSVSIAPKTNKNLFWSYKGHNIRYLSEELVPSGDNTASLLPSVLMGIHIVYSTYSTLFPSHPALYTVFLTLYLLLCSLVHGFGGNADQFRFNMKPLREQCRQAFAIDLLGYGYSDKPSPKELGVNQLYNFENWASQLNTFIEEVAQEPVVLVANSVGGVAALQSAVTRPDLVKGIVLINLSMRMLHVKKQTFIQRPIVRAIQRLLRETDIGQRFFTQVATPSTIKTILNQAYGYERTSLSVDDETVRLILEPGLRPGAVEVFLDFISYSGGPLPEELLPQVTCPVRFLWGENDPWEPINQAKSLYFGDIEGVNKFRCVDEFVVLRGTVYTVYTIQYINYLLTI